MRVDCYAGASEAAYSLPASSHSNRFSFFALAVRAWLPTNISVMNIVSPSTLRRSRSAMLFSRDNVIVSRKSGQ
jgi:hypothetical protein